MCGRIALYTPPERLARQFGAGLAPDLGDAGEPHWNIPPTQGVLALVRPRRTSTESSNGAGASDETGSSNETGSSETASSNETGASKRTASSVSGAAEETGGAGEPRLLIASFRWGLIPWWAKDPAIGNKQFNARAETLERKPAFRSALAERRCLVLADGFYEWKRETVADRLRKTPFFFTRSDGEPMAFAGLWETWRDPSVPRDLRQKIRTCTIITTASGPDTEAVHDRMPVVMERGNFDEWLDPGQLDEKTVPALLRPSPAGTLQPLEVSTRVNSVRNDDPELLEGVR